MVYIKHQKYSEHGILFEKKVIDELRSYYSSVQEEETLPMMLSAIHAATNQKFIIIIDEWDALFREAKENIKLQERYIRLLRRLFNGNEYVNLAYMTGILPIKKYGEHSAINIFDEYSMLDSADLAEFFGFTETEVSNLCPKNKIRFSKLQQWYDGYVLNGLHIYNPKSVVDVIKRGKPKNYWTGTETYEALKVYIDMNFDGLKEAVIRMIGSGRCKINSQKFQNDMTTLDSRDDVLTLLVHLGYLTYDEHTDEVFIPNQEISQEFLNSVSDSAWDGVIQALKRSESLLKNTWVLNESKVTEEIAAIQTETSSILKYNDENSLTCTIFMAYYSAKAYYMNPIMELPTGKGFADVVYLPKRNADVPALVVELKWNQSAHGAMKQIKEKQYTSWLKNYTGNILLVRINYNKKKGHECVIEEIDGMHHEIM